MAMSGENPDVSFELRKEAQIDVILISRDVVAQRSHRVPGGPRRPYVAQSIPGTCRDDTEIGIDVAGFRMNQPFAALALKLLDSFFLDRGASGFSPPQQHT